MMQKNTMKKNKADVELREWQGWGPGRQPLKR